VAALSNTSGDIVETYAQDVFDGADVYPNQLFRPKKCEKGNE